MEKRYTLKEMAIGVIIAIAAINAIGIVYLSSSISNALDKAMELNRPANLSVTIIRPTDCENCFDIDEALEKIKNANVLIKDEKSLNAGDEGAKALIAKYDIKYLPTLIFTGEIKKDSQMVKAWEGVGEVNGDAVVFTKLIPPYFGVVENGVVGKVKVTYINDKSCKTCMTYEQFVSQLKKGGMIVLEETTLDYKSAEAKKLISEHGINTVPTFILDKEFALYETSKEWARFGKIAENGDHIATQASAPYRDLQSNSIKGLVTAISLVDPSCTECMKPSAIKSIMSRIGLAFASERTVNIGSTEGRALISKYKIEKVPTLILDEEASIYPGIVQSWNQIGTKESDGSYIVRNLSIVKGGKYKDLTTDTITN